MNDESGDDDRDELRSGWGGESRQEWWGWRNESGSEVWLVSSKIKMHQKLFVSKCSFELTTAAALSFIQWGGPARSWGRTAESVSCWDPEAERRRSYGHQARSAGRRNWCAVHRCLQCSRPVSTLHSPSQFHTYCRPDRQPLERGQLVVKLKKFSLQSQSVA